MLVNCVATFIPLYIDFTLYYIIDAAKVKTDLTTVFLSIQCIFRKIYLDCILL